MSVSTSSPLADVADRLAAEVRALFAPVAGRPELATVGRFEFVGASCAIERLRVAGPYAGHDPIRIGLFAGLHGDEPAGCHALVQLAATLLDEPARAAGYELFIYPLLNPTGFAAGARVNHHGLDLNREFWRGSAEAEVQILERELQLHRFDGIVTFHADDTCEGLYGYAHGRTLNEALLVPALRAASHWLPLDRRAVIDGFAACDGLIRDCFPGVLSAPPEQRPQPFDVIIETPALAPLPLQMSAAVAATESILASYPGFISYSQDL